MSENMVDREWDFLRSDAIWTAKDPYFELALMSHFPISVKRMRFATAENLYLACKYHPSVTCVSRKHKVGTDPYVQKRIIMATNGLNARLTQECAVKAGLVRSDWEDIKVDVMRWVLELKLQQHLKTFGKVLTSTKDRIIVNRTRNDKFWGCILDINKEHINVYRGRNQFGILLMELRKSIVLITNGRLTHPDGFLITSEQE